MRTISKITVAVAALASASAIAGASQATIYIGLKNAAMNAGVLTQVATGATFANYAAAYGTFELESVFGGDGVAPTLLGSTTFDLNMTGGAGGVLEVYVTRDNIMDTPPNFRSTFTSNVLPARWTVLQRTYYSATNQVFAGALLSTHLFNTSGLGTFDDTVYVAPNAGPYSLTTRYTITAPTIGLSQNTISIHAGVPEPGTWALMIMGFGGAGAMLRARRRQVVAV